MEQMVNGMPDPALLNQVLQNPAMSNIMQSLLSNPQYMNQVGCSARLPGKALAQLCFVSLGLLLLVRSSGSTPRCAACSSPIPS